MALYDSEKYRTIYTDIGKKDDTCIYCNLAIKDLRLKKQITTDEAIAETKKINGNLENKRVAKFSVSGNSICICGKCLTKALNEIEKNKETSVIEEMVIETDKDTLPKQKVSKKKSAKNE